MGRVLSVASEMVPFVKTGGLADVVGALPAALAPLGWQMKTLLPAYRSLLPHLDQMAQVMVDADLFGGPARVMAGVVAWLGWGLWRPERPVDPGRVPGKAWVGVGLALLGLNTLRWWGTIGSPPA